jgi:hypothetical protein
MFMTLSWVWKGGVVLMLVGCASRQVTPEAPRAPARPTVETEAKSTEPEAVSPAPPDAPPAEPEGLSESEAQDAFETTKDPFNSATVDDNREGTYIKKRILTLPTPDPPPQP